MRGSQNAASVALELPPTQIVFFGNPNSGAPVMQKNQLAGLDLPQKVLFYEDENEVFALYNSTQYLASRYGVNEDERLPQNLELYVLRSYGKGYWRHCNAQISRYGLANLKPRLRKRVDLEMFYA
ncbi:DUF302 domain-containing protein [Pricia sp. S334]|uniref:DUF302 domain-containing protein n=1 Tax=Pricia mediterranea TaxID=3076079 RepID=A0ABU3L8R4_9FLAO|nr:DUF302 domain-containing protein [Pricia sp. S334]MDT7830062.1 DUF302 domain-containing protein [Pricia sp. S334]